MCQFRYFEQVVNQSGHDGAGFVLIVVGEGQLLQMAEKLLSHVALDADANDVAPVLNNKGQCGFQHVNQQKDYCPDDEEPHILIWHVVIDDIFGNYRIEQIAAGHDECTEHVQRKELPVGFIVFCKFF